MIHKINNKQGNSGNFSSLEIFCVFDWIQIIVGLAGVLRITIGQHCTNHLSNLRTISPKMRLQKDTCKQNYIMGLMINSVFLLTKLYNTFYPEKCLHFPLPVTLRDLSVPNSLSLQLSSDSNRSRR